MFDRSVLLGLRSAAQALECDKSLAQRDRIAQATEKLHGAPTCWKSLTARTEHS
jgi:hypothetical protein